MTDGSEDVRTMSCGSFDTISMVDSSFACFVVYVEVLEVVVEINGAGAEVSAQERGVRGEDGRDVDVALATERDPYPREPFVEMGDDGLGGVAG